MSDLSDTTIVINERFKSLPNVVKEAYLEIKFDAVVQELMQTYKLHVDQGEVLGQEILLIIVGSESADKFVDRITNRLHITRDQAQEILEKVNVRVLHPLREALHQSTQLEAEASEEVMIPEVTSSELSPTEFGETKVDLHLREEVKKEEQMVTQPPIVAPTSPAPSFVEQKLTETMHVPRVETTATPLTPAVELKKEENKPQNLYNGADPYREPLA